MTDLRQRNNLSSKKSYEKAIEREYAEQYEHEMIKHFVSIRPSAQAYHWSVVPED
jgi:hypothetical protein